MFYAVLVLAVSVFISFGLRALIIGERFDRALHRVDPTYRNFRDMGREFLVDPIGALRRLPGNYGRYLGHYFRPVEDSAVVHLRRRAVRAFVDYAIFGVAGMIGVFVVAHVLRGLSPSFHDIAVITSQALLGLYWVRRLRHSMREADRSTMTIFYILAAVAASIGAIAASLMWWSRGANH